MNKSLLYGICAAILLLGTYFFVTSAIRSFDVLIDMRYAMIVIFLGVFAGIIAFFKGIGEVRRKENKLQAVTGIVLGFVLGILPPLVWLIGMAMILMSGTH